MKRILLILVSVALLLIGLAVLTDPTFRYPWFGVLLERDLTKLQGEEPIALMLSVEAGTELVSEEDLETPPSVQDTYSLLILLKETLQAQKKSGTVRYDIEQMESEQWAWQQARLDKLAIRSEVFPRSLPIAPQLTIPEDHEVTRPAVWAPWLATMWPKLPSGLQKAGKASWSERLSVPLKDPVSKEDLTLTYQLVYQLRNFQNTSQGVYANISMVGTLLPGQGLSEGREISGKFLGFVLLDPESGKVVGGEYRIEQVVTVRQAGLPAVRQAVYQGARFWRPTRLTTGFQSGAGELSESWSQDQGVPTGLDAVPVDQVPAAPTSKESIREEESSDI